jgi:hypothetical protein
MADFFVLLLLILNLLVCARTFEHLYQVLTYCFRRLMEFIVSSSLVIAKLMT